ncbi:MAG TPA: glycosyltransferase [Anaerolineae bacterium]
MAATDNQPTSQLTNIAHALRVSVVIPVRNGGVRFRGCLDAIRTCDPPPFEVIVVDDGSTDDPARAARERGAHLLSTDRPASGPARARNLGAQHAAGDVLLFVDADVALHPDAVGRVVRNFQSDPDLAACFGSYDDDPAAPNFLSQYKNLFHHYVHQSARAEASTFWAGCGAIRRDVFLSAGGFSPRYDRPAIEDIELGHRLKMSGCKLRLDKDLQGKHLKKWTLRSLLKSDIFDRGVPWTELILRDGAFVNDLNLQTHNRASVVIVYLLLMTLAAGFIWPALWLASGALAIVLLVLNRAVYRLFAVKRGTFFALRVIPMHWLYYTYNGVSFAVGLGRHIWTQIHADTRGFRLYPAFLLILLLAAVLRFAYLSSSSFWYDELLQVTIASQNLPALIAKLGEHAAMPLDYLVTHVVLLLGRSEFLLRFPSAFWGLLTLPLVYQIGRRLFNRAVGIAAMTMLAVSGLHAFYSAEMRPYALVTFLAALSFYALMRALSTRRWRDWLGYSLAIAAGVLTHYFMLFVIGAQGLIVLGVGLPVRKPVSLRSRVSRFGLALMPVLGALALTPWFGSVLDVGRLFAQSIVTPGAIPASSLLGEVRGGATPIDLTFFQDQLLGSLSGGGPILPIAFLVLLLMGIGFGLRRTRAQTIFLLTWAIVPSTLIVVFLYTRGTFFAVRYILFALPALLILIAFGIAETIRTLQRAQRATRFTPFVAAAASVLLLALVWHRAVLSVSAPRENWREAGRFLSDAVRPGDQVILPPRGDLILFYAPSLAAEIRPSDDPADLPNRLEPGRRVWLVVTKYALQTAYRVWAEARSSVEYRVDDAVQVFLMEDATSQADLLRASRPIEPPRTWPAWAALADQNEVVGDVDMSVEQYRHAITLAASPEQAISLTLSLGDVLRRARRFDEALAEYQHVATLDASRVEARVGAGRVYLEQGRLDEARAQFVEALALDPQSYAANLFLAESYQRAGQLDQAEHFYALAAERVPELIAPP